MQIAGLPLHPLVVHAAVVLIPLTALLTIGLAVLPRWRWLLRWPTAGASVLCIVLGIPFLLAAIVLARRLSADPNNNGVVAVIVTLGFLGWTLYKWLTEDVYFLNKPKSLIYMGSLYGLALLVYLVARLIRWRQGVPLKAIHSEIPAE